MIKLWVRIGGGVKIRKCKYFVSNMGRFEEINHISTTALKKGNEIRDILRKSIKNGA